MAEGKPGQGLARRCRRLFSARRLLFPDNDRDPFPGRALPRRRSGRAGHGGRPHRSHVFPGVVALASIRGGDIKAFAVAAKSRLKAAPDIPTVDEAGLPGFHTSVWQAFWAPKGTSKDVVGTLNAAIVSSLAEAAVISRLADLGLELPPREQQTPEGLGAHQKAEIEKWWPIIKAANIKAE